MANGIKDLTFNVAAMDRGFVALGEKLDRLTAKLDKLDRKRVNAEVNVDIDKGLANVGRFADSSSGIMSGALKIVSANAILMGVAVVAGLAVLPAAAAAAATGIVLAFGGGLAAIGIAVAAQNKRVRNAFGRLKEDVLGTLKEISKPFIGTLVAIADVARKTFHSFVPALRSSFKILAPAVEQFARDFGRAFAELAPAVRPLSRAFSALLRELGPRLRPLFEDIAASLIDLARVVRRNADEFAGFITGMLKLIPLSIVAIAKLAGWFVTLRDRITNALSGGQREIRLFKKTFAPIIQDVVRLIRQHWGPIKAWVRRNFGEVRQTVREVLKTIRFLWRHFGDETLAIVKRLTQAWGRIIGHDLRTAARIVRTIMAVLRGDWRTAWNNIKDIVRDALAKVKEIYRFQFDILNAITGGRLGDMLNKVRRIFGTIRSVVGSRLSAARRVVGNILGSIRDAFFSFARSGPVRVIKTAFDAIAFVVRGVTGAVRDLISAINSIPKPDVPGIGDLIGGFGGFLAHGGRARAGRVHVVGERGPELFVPDTSGTVVPNDQLHTGGVTIEHLEVKSIGPRFDLRQVLDSLAWQVAS